MAVAVDAEPHLTDAVVDVELLPMAVAAVAEPHLTVVVADAISS